MTAPNPSLATAKAATDAPDYVDGDRTGYSIIVQGGEDENIQTSYAVVLDETGRGLGAFHSLAEVDQAIAFDRATTPNALDATAVGVVDGKDPAAPAPTPKPAASTSGNTR